MSFDGYVDDVAKGKRMDEACPLTGLGSGPGRKPAGWLQEIDLVYEQLEPPLAIQTLREPARGLPPGPAAKPLRGPITLNESLLLGEDWGFEWNSVTARDRTREILAEDGQIFTLKMKNIRCSTGVLQDLMQLLPRFIKIYHG